MRGTAFWIGMALSAAALAGCSGTEQGLEQDTARNTQVAAKAVDQAAQTANQAANQAAKAAGKAENQAAATATQAAHQAAASAQAEAAKAEHEAAIARQAAARAEQEAKNLPANARPLLEVTPIIKAAILADPVLNNAHNRISVTAASGVVHLAGHVQTADMKSRATQDAQAVLNREHWSYKIDNQLAITH